jgi:hypothetical protein
VASWSEIEAEAPDLSALARRIFDRHIHKTLATLRRDGSPRISGTEVTFAEGEMWIGSMARAVKARDLQRDPRFALHSHSGEMPGGEGDAKVAGRAEEVPSAGDAHRFRLNVTELVVTNVGEPPDHLVIRSWHEGRGESEFKRK